MSFFTGLNPWALLLAAIASFLFGGVWYGLFSKPWMAAVGKTEAQIKASGTPMWVLFVISFVAELIMAWMLAGVLLHLAKGGLPATLRNGMISAFFIWFGFVLTTLVVNHAYQDARRMLTLIDGGHWLGVLLLQGAVLGYMGVR